MARGGWYVVRRRGGQTQYSSTSLKHHTPRGEGWSQDGVVAARGEGFAQRGGRRKLSARRGGQILRGSGTGGSLSVMVEGRSGPNARNTRFALVRSLPQLAAALDPGIPGRHPLAVGLSRVQREGHRGARVAARAEVAFGRPRAATGRRRAVRRRQGEASGAARGGGRPGWVGGRRGRAGGGVAARLGRGEARQQVPQRPLAGGAEWRVSQRIAEESDTGRKIASANCRSRSLMIAGDSNISRGSLSPLIQILRAILPPLTRMGRGAPLRGGVGE